MADILWGFLAGVAIATLTAPVGVSGAVFLLPVQLSVLHVPNPAVTPTNLLYNVIAGPGAIIKYRRNGQLNGQLTRRLLVGTVPGVMVGAVIRVFLLPGARPFRIVSGLVLLVIGVWLIRRTVGQKRVHRPPSNRALVTLALGVGVIGGIYGIGGGSIISPILVGSESAPPRGLPDGFRLRPDRRNSPQIGTASWYGPGFHGKTTSSREIYDMYDVTAAHNTLPLGTRSWSRTSTTANRRSSGSMTAVRSSAAGSSTCPIRRPISST